MRGLGGILCALPLATACAVHQDVRPVELASERLVCIVLNPAVRSGVPSQIRSALRERGFDTRDLPSGSPIDACEMTLTYTARWSWDWFWTGGVYLSQVDVRVYRGLELAGYIAFDTTGSPASLGRVVEATPKIHELMGLLFPHARWDASSGSE